jgi:hypothetical protein
MKYSLRSLMIVVTLVGVCLGITRISSCYRECDGLVLFKGRPVYRCGLHFWRVTESDVEEYWGFSDDRGRYTLRNVDGSRAPSGEYFAQPGTAYRANPKLFEHINKHWREPREVTVSPFGILSHRIPDMELAP